MAGFLYRIWSCRGVGVKTDDALAIFGPGEEIHLEFETPADALPAGWHRSFVFESNGWAKDMDLFTKDGATLAPLPKRNDSTDQPDLLHARFNTRYRSGR